MILIALLLAVAAFVLFAGSSEDQHHKRFGRRPTLAEKRRLRAGAWIAIAGCFAGAVAARGWVYGPVTWFGLVMAGAAAVFLAANFIPVAQRQPAKSPVDRAGPKRR